MQAASDSEQARKRLRIARMRKTTAVSDLKTGGEGTVSLDVLNDPDADYWQKEQALKQIAEVREMKKRQLFLSQARN